MTIGNLFTLGFIAFVIWVIILWWMNSADSPKRKRKNEEIVGFETKKPKRSIIVQPAKETFEHTIFETVRRPTTIWGGSEEILEPLPFEADETDIPKWLMEDQPKPSENPPGSTRMDR